MYEDAKRKYEQKKIEQIQKQILQNMPDQTATLEEDKGTATFEEDKGTATLEENKGRTIIQKLKKPFEKKSEKKTKDEERKGKK